MMNMMITMVSTSLKVFELSFRAMLSIKVNMIVINMDNQNHC